MENKSAVEFFKNELIKRFKKSVSDYRDSEATFDMIRRVEKQAKEMFEQQIKDAWGNGWSNGHIKINQYEDVTERYYNETFKK